MRSPITGENASKSGCCSVVFLLRPILFSTAYLALVGTLSPTVTLPNVGCCVSERLVRAQQCGSLCHRGNRNARVDANTHICTDTNSTALPWLRKKDIIFLTLTVYDSFFSSSFFITRCGIIPTSAHDTDHRWMKYAYVCTRCKSCNRVREKRTWHQTNRGKRGWSGSGVELSWDNRTLRPPMISVRLYPKKLIRLLL